MHNFKFSLLAASFLLSGTAFAKAGYPARKHSCSNPTNRCAAEVRAALVSEGAIALCVGTTDIGGYNYYAPYYWGKEMQIALLKINLETCQRTDVILSY